jgi:hypothetical protein
METKLSTEKARFTDIALVAYLVCEGYKVMSIDREGPRGHDKSAFYFDSDEKLKIETLKFFNGEARVDPLKFNEALRSLRSYAKQG